MKVVNSSEMKNIDNITINEFGLPSLVLMERAALGVVDFIKNDLSQIINSDKNTIIVAGTGNNGADGLAIARLLSSKNKKVKVILIGDEQKRTVENLLQLQLIKKLGIEFHHYSEKTFSKLLLESDLIIDAILGIGIKRDLDDQYLKIVEQINNFDGKKISVDIPTGINTDTGNILGNAVKSNYTITFGFIKVGMLMDQALDYVGKIQVIDLGYPDFYQKDLKINYLDESFIKTIFPDPRKKSSFKNSYGRTLLIGGSETMSGAIVLSAKSALKVGSGLVNILVPKSIHSIVAQQISTAMTASFDSNNLLQVLKENMTNADSIVIGPGASKHQHIKQILEYILENFEKPIVIDADGLNILSENMNLIEKIKYPVILTPHIGELARLLNTTNSKIKEDRLESIKIFNNKYNAILVSKAAKTIISDKKNIFINSTGNPILARGGTGDILSGMIGGLLAQKIEPLNASLLGVHLHGLAGDLALNDYDENSIITEELIEYVSKAFKSIRSIY